MRKLVFVFLAAAPLMWGCADKMSFGSPDGNVALSVETVDGEVKYKVTYGGVPFLESSPLGIATSEQDFTKALKLLNVSDVRKVSKNYSLNSGKVKDVSYQANERVYEFENPAGARMDVIFRVADDGAAFAYRVHGEGETKVTGESSGFRFPEVSTAFISPMAKAKTGFARTNPSYEDQYQRDMKHGTPSAYGQGWVFPALFKIGEGREPAGWVLLSETGVDGSYVASHLAENTDGGLYRLEFAHSDNDLPEHQSEPSVTLPYTTPWRMAVVSRDLNGIVTTTMAEDLVEPKYDAKYEYKPGRASWSWVKLKDESMNWNEQVRFVDFAADMGFEYTLVDALWDVNLGYGKIEELAAYADSKGVKLILWYNSNGDWNDAPQTPKDKMHIPEARRAEMAWMQKTGIKGIKVDFFGGDKQFSMKLYEDILRDANDHGIYVNFHGATLPRGWDVMYPGFATTEAVMGEEFVTFSQGTADQQPVHCTTLPFTRNVVAAMDFTPVILDRRLGSVPGTGVHRRTSTAFEMALPVIFYSGVQHYGLTPEDVARFPEFVKDYFKAVPATWDETILLSGYPGSHAVMARRSGDRWFIGGICSDAGGCVSSSAQNAAHVFKGQDAVLIYDGATADMVEMKSISLTPESIAEIKLKPEQGFVIYTK